MRSTSRAIRAAIRVRGAIAVPPSRFVRVADDTLILGLLNVLEREILPAIESGNVQAWSKGNRIADAVLAMLTETDRVSLALPSHVGALQAIYVEARKTREDKAARACALYTLVTRAKDAIDPQRKHRPTSIRPPQHSLIPPPERELPAWVPDSGILGGFRLVRPMASGGLGSLFLARRLEDENDPLAREVVLRFRRTLLR